MDTFTPEQRSRVMSRIRGKNTKPELIVRSLLHRAGYRFSLHRKDLPGKPDIVLRKYNTVVFVHGCFWHRHQNCKTASMPKSNVEYWQAKFERNVSNDRKHIRELKKMGWNVIVVWECELKQPEKVLAKLEKSLTAAYAKLSPKVVVYPTTESAPLPLAAEAQAEYKTKPRK
ncbi:very short patch repair endonuclease [Pontiella sulfatireligans]|uniref:Very short patch repair protein n=1 Tax=Pontiella sulfatireligans TaxID=2750658 RepID=A0A6C2UP09_9BACT|nr:very short patch repair endonuclease [Pontiella sulfatireligans]VGO21057.1 Very short patch repair protein [Pontiella sulfatireligans]